MNLYLASLNKICLDRKEQMNIDKVEWKSTMNKKIIKSN